MPNDNAIKFGILKTRDLVELYYGARMVVSIIETPIFIDGTATTQILGADPRRIRYEINFQNQGGVPLFISIGSKPTVDAGNGQLIAVPNNQVENIERNFLTDLEAVCLDVWGQVQGAGMLLFTRETFLTPIPVDEMP